jgi:serine/threonine-protein kinase
MQERIGHYRIVQEIGHGAMGRVWLAHDDVIKRNVAIKELLFPQGIGEEDKREAIERFEREAQAAGSLSHPNIVTIFNVEEAEGIPFIVMEYLEGATLAQVIQEGPMTVPRSTGILAQLCDALSYAHAHQVVHRDIKPENIFLLFDGRLKVTDFGIARVLGTSTVTQIGTVMGTPGYMSPEQVKGERVDWRTDIFSTGVLLYEMLTGRNPFEADTPTSVMYKVVHEEPPPLSAINPDLPPHLQAVITRACAKDRDARYQDALELKRDLEEKKAPAAPPEPREATVLRAPVEATVPPPPPVPVPPAPSKRRSSTRVIFIIIAVAVVLFAGGLIAIILATSSSSSETSEVAVPDLVGITWEEARSEAESAGLDIERSEVSTGEYPEGEVIAQEPAAGEKVEKGSMVNVDVAMSTSDDTQDDTDKDDTTVEPENLSGMATINATSILAPDAPGVSYATNNLVDNVPETCWAEGAPGYGIGEQVIYNFPREVEVTKIYCIPGFLKTDDKGQDRWLQNGRLKTVRISFDDGTETTFTFTDEKKWQEIVIDPAKKTRNVTITILDVYPGQSGPNWSAAEDTSVSEIHFWGYK